MKKVGQERRMWMRNRKVSYHLNFTVILYFSRAWQSFFRDSMKYGVFFSYSSPSNDIWLRKFPSGRILSYDYVGMLSSSIFIGIFVWTYPIYKLIGTINFIFNGRYRHYVNYNVIINYTYCFLNYLTCW